MLTFSPFFIYFILTNYGKIGISISEAMGLASSGFEMNNKAA